MLFGTALYISGEEKESQGWHPPESQPGCHCLQRSAQAALHHKQGAWIDRKDTRNQSLGLEEERVLVNAPAAEEKPLPLCKGSCF